MYFINKSANGLILITSNPSAPSASSTAPIQIINNIKQLTCIGQNSIYDNHLAAYVNQQCLTFNGYPLLDPAKELPFELYKLDHEAGFIFHDQKTRLTYLSPSIYQLVNYCLDLGISIQGIIDNNSSAKFVFPKITINNDFSRKKIRGEDIDADRHLSFDLGWNFHPDQIEFDMVILNEDYKVNVDGRFFEEYTGTAINIGKFRKTNLKELEDDDRLPDFFPELDLQGSIVFTELFDDNAYSVLVPAVMTTLQYENILNELKTLGRQRLDFNGTCLNGYGIQARIELLDEAEQTSEYQARVSRLVISPNSLNQKTFMD